MSLLWRGGVLLLWFDMIQRQASLLRDSPLLTGRSLIKRSRERSIYSSVESLQTSHLYICFPLVFGGVQIWQHSYGCVSAWLMNESELLLVSVGPAQPSVRVTRPKCHILWWWGATGRLCGAVFVAHQHVTASAATRSNPPPGSCSCTVELHDYTLELGPTTSLKYPNIFFT